MKVFENIKQKFEPIKEKIKNISVKKTVIISALTVMTVTTVAVTAISATRNASNNYGTPTDDTQKNDISVFNPNVDTNGESQNGSGNNDPIIHTDERGLEFVSNGNGTCYVNGFGSCQLSELSIPQKSPLGETVVKISAKAFAGSERLLTIDIPSTVKTIETGAFRGCSNLVSINVDIDNSIYCSVGGVLFSEDRSVLVCYPMNRASNSYLLPKNVRSISAYAFEGVKNLKKLLYEESISSFQKINILIGNEILDGLTVTCNYVPSK